MKKKYLSFEEAKIFVQKLNLKNQSDWYNYIKSNNKPENIPNAPHYQYKNNGWISWGDWLGSNFVCNRLKKYLSYDDAKRYIQDLKIINWDLYIKTETFPNFLPKNPYGVYKNKGWISWNDFLGKSEKLSFIKAKEFILNLNINGERGWREYIKNENFPNFLPKTPSKFYNEEWISWGDFLGTNSIATFNRKYLKYDDAVKYVHKFKFKNREEWIKYTKSDEFPDFLPNYPNGVYKEWTTWGDWIGTGTIASFLKNYLSYDDAKTIVHKLNFKNQFDWNEYKKTISFPVNIPKDPQSSYKDKGWISWGDFLGTGNVASKYKEFLPFEDAKIFVHNLNLKNVEEWKKYMKSNSFNILLPSNPNSTYTNEWKGWGDWLGIINLWNKTSILNFLNSIKDSISTLDFVQLVTMLNDSGLNQSLSKNDKLKKLQETKPNTKERLDAFDDLIKDIENTKDEDIQKEYNDDGIEIIQEKIDEIDTLKNFNFTDGINFLDNPFFKDTKKGMTDEGFKFQVNYMVKRNLNLLLQLDENKQYDEIKKQVDELKSELDTAGYYEQLVINNFLDIYDRINKFEIPFKDDYVFPHEPNLSQKLFYILVEENKRYLNLCGMGAGKSLAVVMAGIGLADKTIIFVNNSTKKEWKNKIDEYYKNQSDRFVIVNYEQLQLPSTQKRMKKIVDEFLTWGTTMVVFDEIHNIKRRDNQDDSIRRDNAMKLLKQLDEKTQLYIVGATGTPLKNDLSEPLALLETITLKSFDDVDTRKNVKNALEVYKHLINNGIRYIPDFGIKTNIPDPIMVNCNHLIDELKNSRKMLDYNKITLNEKLKNITPLLKKGTILFTNFVEDIIPNIKNYIEKTGLKCGLYYGGNIDTRDQDKQDFIDGKIDILIGTKAISEGVDGLQKVCNQMIFIIPPWTNSDFEQTVSRIRREGSNFKEIDIILVKTFVDLKDGEKWSYDDYVYQLIDRKKTLANTAVDGEIPEELELKRDFYEKLFREKIKDLIDNYDDNQIRIVERDDINIKLDDVVYEVKKRELGDFSEFNRSWNVQKSKTTHYKLVNNPDDWYYYHQLYRERRKTWDEIPFEVISKKITNPDYIVADMGCGEDLLRKNIKNKVYSFDHISIDENVVSCDISNVPLEDNFVNIVVFSLSLMGANYDEYLKEAYRILKPMSFMYICEVRQRFEDKLDDFKLMLESIGFKLLDVKKTEKFIYWDIIKM